MKQHFLPALRLTFVSLLFFCGVYSLLILGVAQAAPNKGEGETVTINNKVIGYKLEGQSFTSGKYFNGRPSAAGYNAAGSAGSNKGPSNPEYLEAVQDRIDTFLVHNPTIRKQNIPADMVTASGSGLDPDISLQGAMVQVDRIAKERKIESQKIIALIQSITEKSPFNGIEKINVLKLNIALENLK